jgi:hypothetical protein
MIKATPFLVPNTSTPLQITLAAEVRLREGQFFFAWEAHTEQI